MSLLTRWLALALVAAVASLATAADVRGRLIVPEPSFSRVSLAGGKHVGIVRRDGVFVIHDVSPGVYLMDVYSNKYVFARYRVTVQSHNKVHAVEFPYPGAPKRPVSYPLIIKPQTVPVFFPARPTFNPLSYLKNPMVLIMLVAMGMMFLPKLMGEETMEEMKKQQEEMGQQGGLAGMLGINMPDQKDDDESSGDEDDIQASLPGVDGLGGAAAPRSARTPASTRSSAASTSSGTSGGGSGGSGTTRYRAKRRR